MKILLADKIILGGYNTSKTAEYKKSLESFAGQWIEVETEYLFENQYNVTLPNGKGVRIMETQVRDIMDDERTGRQFCNYCHKHSPINGIDLCPHCRMYGYVKPFNNVLEQHEIQVNKNWKIQFATKCGSITPYGYAEIHVVNKKTGEVVRCQKWQYWDSCHIEKKLPQEVKNKVRSIFEKYGCHFRTWWETSYTERNY